MQMPNPLNSHEIDALLQILALASQKGVFNGPDLPTVGVLWNRLDVLRQAAQAVEAQQNEDAAKG